MSLRLISKRHKQRLSLLENELVKHDDSQVLAETQESWLSGRPASWCPPSGFGLDSNETLKSLPPKHETRTQGFVQRSSKKRLTVKQIIDQQYTRNEMSEDIPEEQVSLFNDTHSMLQRDLKNKRSAKPRRLLPDISNLSSSSLGPNLIRKSDPSTNRNFTSKENIRAKGPLYLNQVKLERVLGLTVPSNAALDCNSNTGVVAYPTGCTVVLLNAKKNRQSHVQNACRKTVTCVTFSSCGRYLATGEMGHAPSVRVWDLTEKIQMAEFSGHKFGVSCVAFSPAQKYVVSVGSQHDMIVNVWDWRAGVKVASNKFSSKVKAVSFAENGSYFVTVGNRHVKFWYLDVARGSKFKEPVPLTGRSAILGEQRNNYFCDVACGRGDMGDSTFAITKSGLLCEFNNRRLLDKWVELRTTCANCIVAGEDYLFVGCAEGIIRCFSPFNLQFITTLPRTHYLGVDVSKGLNISHMASHPNNAKYPDTIAITLDEVNHKVTAVYNDRSLYVWDVKDIKRVGKSHSYLYHSACIWGVEMYPKNEGILPEGSFVTCSSDDTMRIWNIDPSMPLDTAYKRNIYSQDLLKVIYVDSEMSFIKDSDFSPPGNDKNDGSYDSRNGVRCIKISYDGKHLASGDRAGNIRIHELQSMEEVCKIEAHDAEVLCLEYCKPETGHNFLSSASRDRLIHVFNVDQDYNFVQTLDDHSSAITSVRFYQTQGNLHMVSCGADRSIIFRSATQGDIDFLDNPQSDVFFSRGHNVAGKTTLYDMEVDHGQRHILTACQDRNIRVYNVNSGKHSKTFKGSVGEDGTLIKVVLDQSGLYAATSCTDKSMCIYDYYSGECMATMFGHSEIVTGLRFTNDGKHLITVSGDGCIFIWSLPRDMTHVIVARLAQQAERALKEQKRVSVQNNNVNFQPASDDVFNRNEQDEPEEPDYRFSVGQLPLWAKKQITDKPPAANKETNSAGSLDMPKGRWKQRLPNNPITFKSHYDTDSTVHYPSVEKRNDSESSKESSLEDNLHKKIPPQPPPRRNGSKPIVENHSEFIPCPESVMEINLSEENFKNVSKVSTKRGSVADSEVLRFRNHNPEDSDVSSFRVDDPATTTDHDGDIEDCSEHDDESPSHLIYYPPSLDTTGDFTVNAMDVEELRRSQRRHRKARPERPTDIPLASISGSQESDEEDEVSTPSADTAERNILSMLSVSMESVDRVGRRETFLKNNFESLEGDTTKLSKSDLKNKNSISYKFNARNREASNTSKRQELLRRIDETRKKLQSIGYKSTLRSSKSISDLCNIPEKDSSYIGSSHQGIEEVPFVLPLPPVVASHFSSNLAYPLVGLASLADQTFIDFAAGESAVPDKSMPQDVGGAIFDESSVPPEKQPTGRLLLLQLEKDLKTFEHLLYGGGLGSPLDQDTDSLEETVRSLRLSNADSLMQTQPADDSDTDTIRSEVSNFSCDSLDNHESCSSSSEEISTPDQRKSARDKGLLRLSKLDFGSATLPSRKRPFRWADKKSLTKHHTSVDGDKDSFVNIKGNSSAHKKVYRTSSEAAITKCIDNSQSNGANPTNPPYFKVRSPLVSPSDNETTFLSDRDSFHRSSDPNLGPHRPLSSMEHHQIFSQKLLLCPSDTQHSNHHNPAIRSLSGMRDSPVLSSCVNREGPPSQSLAKRFALHQLLPSKHGGSGDSGFSSGTGGSGMRRACSLSDLTNPSTPRRLLPNPSVTVSGKKTGRNSKSSARSQGNLSRSSSIGVLNQTGDEGMRTNDRPTMMRQTIASMSKMTPRALKRKSSLSQAASTGEKSRVFSRDSDFSDSTNSCMGTGDIRHLHEDSSSEDISPTEHKNIRGRGSSVDRRNAFPTRAVSERDLTRSNSVSGKVRHDSFGNGRFLSPDSGYRRQVSMSDMSRPSSAASTVDFSPEEYSYFHRLDMESAPLTVTLVESVCEWVVEGCERLSHLWWRTCAEGNDSSTSTDEDRHRALRSLLLGAAARATHALSPLTNPNTLPPLNPPHISSGDSKDPRVVAMMQQYTDVLVNMVQQKIAQQQPPKGPT